MQHVQVILSEDDREAFRRRAEAAGRSPSSWLRDAGRRQLERETSGVLADVATAEAFFAALPERELDREPDWPAHRAVLAESRIARRPPS